ncbi:MAG TPA: hypothetical protein VHE59_18990 [Mucilaginibacter sp.]|nr:hypothetical protein [Bacteroidota bacterium]HVS94134.1 hypothetical protein [Mucilaginibacter sp.]
MEYWDFYISGIWKQKLYTGDYISDVFLHSAADGFGKGVKTSSEDVVDLLKKGARITTITWNYHLMQWRYGARVEYIETDEGVMLRTEPGAATFDDLESAIQMQYILDEQIVISH